MEVFLEKLPRSTVAEKFVKRQMSRRQPTVSQRWMQKIALAVLP